MKNKYKLINGNWKIAQSFTAEEGVSTPQYDDASSWYNPASWFGGEDYTSIRAYAGSNGLDSAIKLLQDVYGTNFEGEGRLIKHLRDLSKVYRYVDDDFPTQINHIIEDLLEVKEINLNVINELRRTQQDAASNRNLETEGPSSAQQRGTRPGKPGQSGQNRQTSSGFGDFS
jgi:hypothetical protein